MRLYSLYYYLSSSFRSENRRIRRTTTIGQQMECADVDLPPPTGSADRGRRLCRRRRRPSARHFSKSWPPTRRVTAAPPTTCIAANLSDPTRQSTRSHPVECTRACASCYSFVKRRSTRTAAAVVFHNIVILKYILTRVNNIINI